MAESAEHRDDMPVAKTGSEMARTLRDHGCDRRKQGSIQAEASTPLVYLSRLPRVAIGPLPGEQDRGKGTAGHATTGDHEQGTGIRGRDSTGLEGMKEQTAVLGKLERIWSRGKDMGAGREFEECQRTCCRLPPSPPEPAVNDGSQGPKASQELGA